MKLCIVTPDILGPVRNGGIGTACTNLAHTLTTAGHNVEILFTQAGSKATHSDQWATRYRKAGIRISVLQEWIKNRKPQNYFPNHALLARSYQTYLYLKEKPLDAIIFMDWQGNGFYSLHAKNAGISFQKTALAIQLHSPTLWHDLYNATLPGHPDQVLTYFMERKSIELADIAVSPSKYMFNWLKRASYKLPRNKRVIPNIVRTDEKSFLTAHTARIQELVFFGRLEYRKGLVQFCNSLDLLARTPRIPIEVTFLGKFSYVDDTHSAVYISNRARNWPFPIKILPGHDQQEALAYLSRPGRLAVIPSIVDNSPYTVYECLTHRIPFLARDSGGTKELIRPADRSRCLFSDTPLSLCEMLEKVLGQPPFYPQLAFAADRPTKLWTEDFIAQCAQIASQKNNTPQAQPLISVCLTHYNRPTLLKQALDSLQKQTYSRFEVILADDGSTTKEAIDYLDTLAHDFKQKNWKLLRLQNGYLGRARNMAAEQAKGDYLLFMDDDNVAMPDMLRHFATAAESSRADVVTCAFSVFSSNARPNARTPISETYLPLGDCISIGAITNIFGDANSLFRKSKFRQLGGFTEDYGIGHEDYELHARATLNGCKFAVVGQPLFWYRRNGDSMLNTTSLQANKARNLRPYLTDAHASHLGEFALLANMHNPTPPQKSTAISGDPESTSNLLLSFATLHANEMSYLADQIANSCSPEVKETYQANRHLLELCRPGSGIRTETGHHPALIGNTTPNTAKLLRTVLDHIISHSARNDDAVTLIARALSTDAATVARAAEYFISWHNYDSAAALVKGLKKMAEQQYLLERPDVATAVAKGEFRDAAHHYETHGTQEGQTWPLSHLIAPLEKSLAPTIPAPAMEV